MRSYKSGLHEFVKLIEKKNEILKISPMNFTALIELRSELLYSTQAALSVEFTTRIFSM